LTDDEARRLLNDRANHILKLRKPAMVKASAWSYVAMGLLLAATPRFLSPAPPPNIESMPAHAGFAGTADVSAPDAVAPGPYAPNSNSAVPTVLASGADGLNYGRGDMSPLLGPLGPDELPVADGADVGGPNISDETPTDALAKAEDAQEIDEESGKPKRRSSRRALRITDPDDVNTWPSSTSAGSKEGGL
jgi:hypothetical protein